MSGYDPADPATSSSGFVSPASVLDLCGTPCPLNFIRSQLALEKIEPGAWMQVDLDGGEPERMVCEGLMGAGHHVQVQSLRPGIVRLLVRRGG